MENIFVRGLSTELQKLPYYTNYVWSAYSTLL